MRKGGGPFVSRRGEPIGDIRRKKRFSALKGRGLLSMLERKAKKAEEAAREEREAALRTMEILIDAVRDPEMLIKALSHKDGMMRFRAVQTLAALAERGMDISEGTPHLAAGLTDDDRVFRAFCGLALAYSAKNGADISRAIPTLGAVLKKESAQTVRAAVGFALCVAGENGADLSPAREALVSASTDDDETVRRFATDALYYICP